MKKVDLTQELAVSEKLHLSTAVKAVDGIIRILKEALVKGEEVTLRGFGTFAVVDVKEHPVIHFKTKEATVIPAHRTVKFRVSKDVKEKLNAGASNNG